MRCEKSLEIETLTGEKKKLSKVYTKTVTERNSVFDLYNEKLAKLRDKIRNVNSKIYKIKHPEED